MASDIDTKLSRRERQIMDILYQRGQATAMEVRRELPDPPGYSAVRSALRLLEQKKWVRHRRDGQRYIYEPASPKAQARGPALNRLLRTFFEGSRKQAISALMEDEDFRISDEEHQKLSLLLDEARQRGSGA